MCILVWKFSVDSNHANCFVEFCNQAAELALLREPLAPFNALFTEHSEERTGLTGTSQRGALRERHRLLAS